MRRELEIGLAFILAGFAPAAGTAAAQSYTMNVVGGTRGTTRTSHRDERFASGGPSHPS